MKTRSIRALVLGAALGLLSGCAMTADPAQPGEARRILRTADSPRNVLSREEIANSQATNLYDVVQRLRPGWLSGRGVQNIGGRTGMIVVYQNTTRMGETGALRDMAPEYVVELRFIDGATAAGLPGIGQREIVAGAIVVVTPDAV